MPRRLFLFLVTMASLVCCSPRLYLPPEFYPYQVDYRAASVTRESVIAVSGSTIHLAYTSDEYCVEHQCGVTNIVYRSSADNYQSRIDVTTLTATNAQAPALAVNPDGSVVIPYLSKEFDASYLNVALRRISSGVVSERIDVSASHAHDSGVPSAASDSTGLVYIAYDSLEYCDANACARRQIALHTSVDNYASRSDIGVDLSGDSSSAQLSRQPASNIVHMLWTAPGAAYQKRWAKSSDAFGTYTTFALGNYVPTSSFAVKSTGQLYVFFATIGGGPGGGCPSGWEYDYRTSADSFASRTAVECEIYGYPPYSFAPGVFVDGSDVVHVAFPANRDGAAKYSVFYRSSADAFASFARVYPASSFGVPSGVGVVVDGAGKRTFVASIPSGVQAGINLYAETASYSQRVVSGTAAGAYSVAFDSSGAPWVTTLQYGNLSAYAIESGETKTFTHFSLPMEISVTSFFPAQGATPAHIYYGSNEYNPGVYNVVERTETDGFASATNVTTSATGLSLSNVLLAKDGSEYVTFGDNVSKVYLAHSPSWAQTLLAPNPYTAFAPAIYQNPVSGVLTALYGGNEPVGFHLTVRQSSDNYASYLHLNTAQPYTDRLMAYDAQSGEGYLLYLSTEASTPAYNWAIRKQSDNFATRTDPFPTSDANAFPFACLNSGTQMLVDARGVLHLLYSSREQVSTACNVAYRNSSNWSQRRDLSSYQTIDAQPAGMSLNGERVRVYCYATSTTLICNKGWE